MSEELKPLSVEEIEKLEATLRRIDPDNPHARNMLGGMYESGTFVPRLIAGWRRYRAALEDQIEVTSDAARTCVKYKAALEGLLVAVDDAGCRAAWPEEIRAAEKALDSTSPAGSVVREEERRT